MAGATDYLSADLVDGPALVRSVRHAIVRKRYENSLTTAQDLARVGTWDVDLTTGRMTSSPELFRLYGLSQDETPTSTVLIERTHPDDRAGRRDSTAIGELETSGKPFVVEHSNPAPRRHRPVDPGPGTSRI